MSKLKHLKLHHFTFAFHFTIVRLSVIELLQCNFSLFNSRYFLIKFFNRESLETLSILPWNSFQNWNESTVANYRFCFMCVSDRIKMFRMTMWPPWMWLWVGECVLSAIMNGMKLNFDPLPHWKLLLSLPLHEFHRYTSEALPLKSENFLQEWGQCWCNLITCLTNLKRCCCCRCCAFFSSKLFSVEKFCFSTNLQLPNNGSAGSVTLKSVDLSTSGHYQSVSGDAPFLETEQSIVVGWVTLSRR